MRVLVIFSYKDHQKKNMPPLCTPEKIGAEELDYERINPIIKDDIDIQNNLYFTPPPSKVKKREKNSEIDEAEISSVLQNVPEIDQYFKIHKIIGRGTFGTVFLANVKGDLTKKKFALKHLIPTSHPKRIAFELKCMKNIGGINNVAGVQISLRHLGNVVFVMEYQNHEPFSSYVHLMDSSETALYMKNLLIALAQVHKFKIIHRDIKPSNFLYDRKKKTFLLIDFGLAQDMEKLDGKKVKGNYGNAKRKRDPLSPISNILQPPKRPALSNDYQNAQNIRLNIPPHTKFSHNLINKENQQKSSFDFTKSTIISTQHNWTTKTSRDTKDNSKDKLTEECHCYGKAKMCSKCSVRPAIKASRAGTPGYRPPEVLFKYPEQTTAIDIWAAGVILLSILSNTINFFESPNDIVAIAELITIFGFDAIKKVACLCGRFLICNETKPKLDLRKICCILRNRANNINLMSSSNCLSCKQTMNLCICLGSTLHHSIQDTFPNEAYQLLIKLLDINMNTRISAEEALKHPFFNDVTINK